MAEQYFVEWPDWIKGKSLMNLSSSPTVARFLFSDFWWLDSVVVGWVSAKVGGNLQRCYSVIPMYYSCFDYGITMILRFFYGFFSGYNKNTMRKNIHWLFFFWVWVF